MVADFVSADFEWLWSPDETKDAHQVMKPRKNQNGYFTSEDIVEQAQAAMKIFTEYYYDH
jgi:hypothetical protein